jgi:hypothetical protein
MDLAAEKPYKVSELGDLFVASGFEVMGSSPF